MTIWARLTTIWARLMTIWAQLTTIWAQLVILWAHFARLWDQVARLWAHFARLWAHLAKISTYSVGWRVVGSNQFSQGRVRRRLLPAIGGTRRNEALGRDISQDLARVFFNRGRNRVECDLGGFGFFV